MICIKKPSLKIVLCNITFKWVFLRIFFGLNAHTLKRTKKLDLSQYKVNFIWRLHIIFGVQLPNSSNELLLSNEIPLLIPFIEVLFSLLGFKNPCFGSFIR